MYVMAAVVVIVHLPESSALARMAGIPSCLIGYYW